MEAETKIKRTASQNSPPDNDALLKIADCLRDQAGKAENAASWRDKTLALLQQDRLQACSLMQVAQLQRDAGAMNADPAFHVIAWTATALAMDAVAKDPRLNEIAAALRAIERREEMEEDEQFPEELLKQWDQRYDEILADILRAYGEGSMADLYLNDRDAFDRQFEASQRQMFPDVQRQS